jgi:hypothetical protein
MIDFQHVNLIFSPKKSFYYYFEDYLIHFGLMASNWLIIYFYFKIIFVGWPFGFDDWCIRLKLSQAKPSQAKSQEPKTGGRERGMCVRQ